MGRQVILPAAVARPGTPISLLMDAVEVVAGLLERWLR
jgi:hypothetical protein